MMNVKSSLTKGTIQIMLLEILTSGELYGYQIVKEIKHRSGGVLEFGQGTVYPLLYKLERSGYLISERKPTESGKERRYYCITEKGIHHLETCKQTWEKTCSAIGKVLGTQPTGVSQAMAS
jgi:PadR family transcriptional regulator, regulatory protein PadR